MNNSTVDVPSNQHNLRREIALAKFVEKKENFCALIRKHGFSLVESSVELAEKFHTGLRADGVTPEFEHQIDIAFYCLGLPGQYNMANLLALAILHDLREDYADVVSDYDIARVVGHDFTSTVALLNKFEADGKQKSRKVYYRALAQDLLASLVKGADRVHNMYGMRGVFDIAKQLRYARDTEQSVVPMLKLACANFPSHKEAYTVIINELEAQIALVRTEAAQVSNAESSSGRACTVNDSSSPGM